MKKFENEKKGKLKKVKYFFSEENKAQSGAVFRLMVDGIVGLAILLVIISALSYFQALRIQASHEKFFSLVKSATDSPTGKVLVEKNLLFVPSGFSTITLRDKINIYEGCFKFKSNLTSANINEDGSKIDFVNNIETNLYAQCTLNGNKCYSGQEECCEFMCIISFGKKLTDN